MQLNKLFGALAAGGLLITPMLAFAAYNDVTLNSDTVINVNSLNIGVSSDSNSVIESITVNAGDFTVTLQPNSTFYATSSDRATFDVQSPNPLSQIKPCSSTESGLTLKNVTSQTTVTITPSSTACSTQGSSSSSGGGSAGGTIVGLVGSGGGGGGGGSTAVAVAPAPASTPAPSITATITDWVAFSSQNNADVTALQKVLAADSTLYPEGKVTGFFGALTRKAVGKFQEKYGIASPGDAGYGNVGPKTRAKLNELGAAPAAGAPSAVAPAVAATGGAFTQPLSKGKSSAEVKMLQQFLNGDSDTKVADSGAGSLGNETNLYGPATQAAVGKFQEKYGIASSGDAGYGNVGPKTRAKLNELMK